MTEHRPARASDGFVAGSSMEWLARRGCGDVATSVFFPEDQRGVRAARVVCRRCDVSQPCLEYALDNAILDGVWGGTTPVERLRLLRQRRHNAVAALSAAS